MSLISKIKKNYNFKIIKSMIESNDFDGLQKMLNDQDQKDKGDYLELIHTLLNQSIQNLECSDFFKPRALMINSFDIKDTKIVADFLKFYLDDFNIASYEHDYPKKIIELSQIYPFGLDGSFEKFIYSNYAMQFILSHQSKNQLEIVRNSFAFFDYQSTIYFTHQAFTKLFFYITKSPITTFLRYKNYFNNDSHQAFNYFFNLDKKNHLTKTDGDNNFEYKQSWEINLSSWANSNTIATFRGVILKIEDILKDETQFFSDIIAHLITNGVQISLDYKKIQNFIEADTFKDFIKSQEKLESSSEISNKDLKFLKKNLTGAFKDFYEID